MNGPSSPAPGVWAPGHDGGGPQTLGSHPRSPVGPGDLIAGKYRVDRVLGVGGMGVVVAATHQQLDQRVALKFLLPEIMVRPDIAARFLREARAAVKIRSEHVARVLDVGTLENGAPYMVMELLEGEDLEHVLDRRGPLPVDESVAYVLEACEAIAEAHAAGIVHRDLKPANLFLASVPSGRPVIKVLDFGISKIPLSEKEQALTREASLVGSPSYMSPEQLRDSRDVDARSDIWSLGVVLYELLARRVPFYRESMGALAAAVIYEPHAPLGLVRGDLPAGFEAVIDRCMEKDPARRFADIAELARALLPFGPARSEVSVERIVHVLGRTSGVVAQTLQSPRASVPSPEVRTLSPTSTPAVSVTRRRLLIPGAFVVVASALVAVYALGARRATAPPVQSAMPEAPSLPSVTTRGDPPNPPARPVALPATVVVSPSASAPPPITSSAAETSSPSSLSTVAPPRPPSKPSVTMGGDPPNPPARPAGSKAPGCKVVSFFDSDGNKHFKQQCP